MTGIGPVPPIDPMGGAHNNRPPKSPEELKEEARRRKEAREKLKKTLEDGEGKGDENKKTDDDTDWEKGVLA